jgi:hypothetical protein
MQRWHLVLLMVILVLLLTACSPYSNSQAAGAQAAPPAVAAQTTDPTAIPQESAVPSTFGPTDSAVMPHDPPDTCPVTLPPEPKFIPPPPYSRYAPYGFWYGTDSLWTQTPGDGVWSGLPHNPEGYTQKVFWWREGYSLGEESQLSVSGRRLDAPAPALIVSRATNAFAADIHSAMLVGVIFPTLGCWEISGRYADAQLSFVVWVAPYPT